MPEPIAKSPRLLVSVRNVDEAVLACAAGADLVDAKDPASGALGALPIEIVREIATRVVAAATSAVAGEPDSSVDLVSRVAALADTGVDYVKVAVLPGWSDAALLDAAEAARGRLIAVLFAENSPTSDEVLRLAAAGFHGAMIDTRGKHGWRLGDFLSPDRLAAFVATCRTHGLLSGLAGSLRVEDVPGAAAYGPDYLGFRGGLCCDGDRGNPLEAFRVRAAAESLRALGRLDAA